MNLKLADGTHAFRVGAAPAEFELPPTHPLGQGQMRLSVSVSSGLVSSVEVTFGDGHRGDEKLLEVRDYRQGLSLINRHNWLTPVAAEIAYARACEELMGLVPPVRAQLLRTLVLNLQNLTGLAQHLAGNVENFSEWLKVRERFVELTEAISGARLHVSFIRLGGVAHDIDAATVSQLSTAIETLCWPEIQPREYASHPAHVARLESQRSELSVFADQILTCLAELDQHSGPIAVTLPKVVRVPVGNSYKECNAVTGDAGVWLHSDGGKSPLRVALRSPSLMSIAQWQHDAVGNTWDFAFGNLVTTPLCYGDIER